MLQEDSKIDANSHEDPAEALMARGAHLRMLRELERQDEEERERVEQQQEETTDDTDKRDANINDTSRSSSYVLDYNSFLSHQRYYDDLKHVDFQFIDFGAIDNGEDGNDDYKPARLVVQQDKSLGKGGLCWDAAFCLGEHLVRSQHEWARVENNNAKTTVSMVELGCGTGLCGMIVAKAVPDVHVNLTDLPELLPLICRNLGRNFQPKNIVSLTTCVEGSGSDHGATPPPSSQRNDHDGNGNESFLEPLLGARSSKGTISSFALDWDDVVAQHTNENDNVSGTTTETPCSQYNVVVGADVVATLYDPIALAHTIYHVAKDDDDDEPSLVYISFKERLSSMHRRFEAAMAILFEDISFLGATPNNTNTNPVLSRNRNPQVGILVAKHKKRMNPEEVSARLSAVAPS